MELDIYFRFLLALLFVLALIAVLAWAARRFGLGGQLVPNAGKTPRLSIVEVKTLDSRRRLVLLKRDEREHLVLLGSGHDLLIESGIPSLTTAASDDAADPATETKNATRRAP